MYRYAIHTKAMTTNTEYSDLRQIIERHGGIVAQVIEPNTLVVFWSVVPLTE